MNLVKDYLRLNQIVDDKQIKERKSRIEELQKIGAYPQNFTYPITLQFELTGQCNLSCAHCYNRSGDADRITLMTPEKWCDLARMIVKDGGIFQCIISGGEPLLLGDHLFDIMDILHDDGTSFVVITNGYLLNKEKVKKFSKYRYFWFQISIDGHCAEIHDSFRGVRGSWERAIQGALEITQQGIPLTIAHSTTPESLKYLEDMVELAYQIGASSIILGEIMPSGRAISNPNLIFSKEQRNYLYQKIDELSKKYYGKITINRAAGLKTQMARYVSEVNGGGIIRPNGDFRLDCMAPFIIGNVLETPLKKMWQAKGINAWQSPKVQEYIQSIQDSQQMGNIRNHVDTDILI